MYLTYVDESGDCGMVNSPTRHFVLTGLVIHELHWSAALDRLVAFRRRMRDAYNLAMREELHIPAMISSPGALVRIPRHDRLPIIRVFAGELAAMSDLRVINVVVDKNGKAGSYDVSGWQSKH